MTDHYEFRLARPPKIIECFPAGLMAMLACFMTSLAWVTATDPVHRDGSWINLYGIWLLPLGIWIPTVILARFEWRSLQSFRAGKPVIIVDSSGITLPGLMGKPVRSAWRDVNAMSLGQRKDGTELRIKAGKLSGSIPLHDLDASPQVLWRIAKECAGRANSDVRFFP